MASRGSRARYYPGANSLTLFSAQGSNPLEDCKVYGKGVQKVYDRSVKGYIYSISGGLQSKLQLPKLDSKAGLQLVHHFLVFQVYVPPSQHFSVELRVSDTKNTRRKMYFSTSFSDIKTTPLHCQIPISMVIRNKWLSLAFHVADLFNSCFRGGVSFRSIDIIILGPVCKLRKIFTMRCRVTETAPHGYMEENSEDCLPQEHLYAVGVEHCIQILDMTSLLSAVHQSADAITADSRCGHAPDSALSARKGLQGKTDSRMVHVAFGTRMPLPLSTVQINTSLPHDHKCLSYTKDRNGRQLHTDTVVCEARDTEAIPSMITRALSAIIHPDPGRRKIESVLLEHKLTRGCRSGHGSGGAPAVEEKDPVNTPRGGVKEAERVINEPNLLPALDPLPDFPVVSTHHNSSTSTETNVGVDAHKSPSKWQGARKRDTQTSSQLKQLRKDSQTRNKEYKPSRYMDSPPGSPPCGWDSTIGGNKSDDTAFNAHFLEGSWMKNQLNEPVEAGKPYCLANSLKEKLLFSQSENHFARPEEMTGATHSDSLKPSSDQDLRQSTSLYSNHEHYDKFLEGGHSDSGYMASTFGKKVDSSDERSYFRASEANGESSGGQSWSSGSSDHPGEELDVPRFMSGGASRAVAEKLGRGAHTKSDILGRLPTPLLTKDLSRKVSHEEDSLKLDAEDEILLEKLLLENKKEVHGSDRWMSGKLSKLQDNGVGDCLDFEGTVETDRDALDTTFHDTLLKMQASRETNKFMVESVRNALEVDPLQSHISSELSALPPMSPSKQIMSHNDEGFVVNKGRLDEDLDLLYDPTLDCYYDPKTNRYYELK